MDNQTKRLNRRKLKRLKNKLWRIYKRQKGISGRIQMNLTEPPLVPKVDVELIKLIFYQEFQVKWKQAKKEMNKAFKADWVNHDARGLYQGIFG